MLDMGLGRGGGGVTINKALNNKEAEKLLLKMIYPNPHSCWVAEPKLELKAPYSFLSATQSSSAHVCLKVEHHSVVLCSRESQCSCKEWWHVVSKFQKGFLDKLAFELGFKDHIELRTWKWTIARCK